MIGADGAEGDPGEPGDPGDKGADGGRPRKKGGTRANCTAFIITKWAIILIISYYWLYLIVILNMIVIASLFFLWVATQVGQKMVFVWTSPGPKGPPGDRGAAGQGPFSDMSLGSWSGPQGAQGDPGEAGTPPEVPTPPAGRRKQMTKNICCPARFWCFWQPGSADVNMIGAAVVIHITVLGILYMQVVRPKGTGRCSGRWRFCPERLWDLVKIL